ncbi:hypothetical protein BS78_K113500 [Paspalum vaginatum]|uniref:Uncharacterized protein n=1 Tax=Paspalum vaginatum TaxID=158149 RepID=A0A9W8CCI7_9POAL|nr:hypothetical protein BS78_K113500 [Paspalum vaginatum]
MARPLYRDVLLIGLRPEDLLQSALRREFHKSVEKMMEIRAARRARSAAREDLAGEEESLREEVRESAMIPRLAGQPRCGKGCRYGSMRAAATALRGSNLFGTEEGGLLSVSY